MTSSAHLDDTDTHLTNAWVPVFWEPVSGTSERLMVGAVVRIGGLISTHRILRDDVLDCLYGKAAAGARNTIELGLRDLAVAARFGLDDMPEGAFGLVCGRTHATEPQSVGEALRTAAVMYSSLANLDALDDAEASDAPSQDESNRRFATEVRDIVVGQHPNLHTYFGRSAELIPGGEPVRFGFCSPRAILHFGVMHAVRQPASVRDARARLWELDRAREITRIDMAALIMATPRADDPTLSDKQKHAVARNLAEIEREADNQHMRLIAVHDATTAAGRVIEYA